MYRNKFIVIGLVIIILCFFGFISGCLKTPKEGGGGRDYSSIPELIVDYDIESECFKIYVKSAVGDYKYDHIKIKINDTQIQENNTYMLSKSCVDTDFTLETEAKVEDEVVYYYICEVKYVNDEEEGIFIMVIDKMEEFEEEIPVSEEDLPWKKILAQQS